MLVTLFKEGGDLRGEKIIKDHVDDLDNKNRVSRPRSDIRRYLTAEYNDKSVGDRQINWCKNRIKTLRESAKKAPFNEAIMARCRAAKLWDQVNTSERLKVERKKEREVSSTNIKGDDEILTNFLEANKVPIQDYSSQPVFIGGDAVALYPSMDILGTTEMIARVVMESNIKFENLNYQYMLVYLYLVLGEEVFRENGISGLVPSRSKWKDSKAKSLSSKINRDMRNWRTKCEDISDQDKKLLVALLLKVSILAIMDSTCYSFGGRIYKQLWGAGIGLRASACMAKLIMGLIDKFWLKTQTTWDINIYLYFRYIDDLRVFLHPISPGWSWGQDGWVYDEHVTDTRSPIQRTKEEIMKSLNAMTDFIQFTTEGEEDFISGFLPTLDFQTKV